MALSVLGAALRAARPPTFLISPQRRPTGMPRDHPGSYRHQHPVCLAPRPGPASRTGPSLAARGLPSLTASQSSEGPHDWLKLTP